MFDIITIGTATKDVFLTSPLFRVLRDLKHLKKLGFPTGRAQCLAMGSKIEISQPVFTTGGGATNTAFTFSRQGLKTATLVKLGNDDSARQIIKELKKQKITPLITQAKNSATAFSVIILTLGGERTILVYRGASEKLNTKELPLKKLQAPWIYISPGDIPFLVIKKIFDYFFKNKTQIAFNPSKYFLDMGFNKLTPLLKKAKVVILNREEAAYLTGLDYRKEKEIFKKLDKIVPGIAAITDGNRGVIVSDGHHTYSAGVFKERKIVDRTGAGDAFASGFVAGLIQRKEKCEKGFCQPNNIGYAIRLGSANATSVIEKVGAKEGILTEKKFKKSPRWKNIKIKIKKL